MTGRLTIIQIRNEMIEAYKKDYEAMRENMIYGESPDPKVLFKKVGKLKHLFRSVNVNRLVSKNNSKGIRGLENSRRRRYS